MRERRENSHSNKRVTRSFTTTYINSRRRRRICESRRSNDPPAICVEWCKTIWARMIDRDDMSMSMTHTGYLKRFQLSRPRLDLNFDILLMDESQDATPVRAGIQLELGTSR